MSNHVTELLAIRTAIAKLPEDLRKHGLRFIAANADLTDKEFQEKWIANLESRGEAAAKEAHRQKVIAKEFLDMTPERQKELIAMLKAEEGAGVAEVKGVNSGGDAGNSEGKSS